MQRLGQTMNLRDARGWMIPRTGTKRRQVYDMLVDGKSAGDIMKYLGLSRPAYNNHRHFITCWEKANKSRYAVRIRTFRRVGDDFVEVHV